MTFSAPSEGIHSFGLLLRSRHDLYCRSRSRGEASGPAAQHVRTARFPLKRSTGLHDLVPGSPPLKFVRFPCWKSTPSG
jgi:hypothetical protein